MSMVERVARAIAAQHLRTNIDMYAEPERWNNAADAYDLTNNNGRFEYDEIARAAIAEMRTPTEQMIDAGVVADTGKTLGERVTNCFTVMIDAALEETGE